MVSEHLSVMFTTRNRSFSYLDGRYFHGNPPLQLGFRGAKMVFRMPDVEL
jgi:hypothetical protein